MSDAEKGSGVDWKKSFYNLNKDLQAANDLLMDFLKIKSCGSEFDDECESWEQRVIKHLNDNGYQVNSKT